MIVLLLAMLSSSSMALVLKLFREPRGNRYGLLLGNYLTCILIALLLMPDRTLLFRSRPVTLVCGAVGGLLFVAGLVTMQSSVRLNGASLSAAFARLGLLVSLIVSLVCFGERPGALQLVGVLLVIPAMLLIHAGQPSETDGGGGARSFPLLLLRALEQLPAFLV